MKDENKQIVIDSINPVMDLLDEVVRKGAELVDKKWMFTYILTCKVVHDIREVEHLPTVRTQIHCHPP